jgi:hypothetical protein
MLDELAIWFDNAGSGWRSFRTSGVIVRGAGRSPLAIPDVEARIDKAVRETEFPRASTQAADLANSITRSFCMEMGLLPAC